MHLKKNQLKEIVIPASVKVMTIQVFDENQLTSVKIIGKNSIADFDNYYSGGYPMWGWASGYSAANIEWNATE